MNAKVILSSFVLLHFLILGKVLLNCISVLIGRYTIEKKKHQAWLPPSVYLVKTHLPQIPFVQKKENNCAGVGSTIP